MNFTTPREKLLFGLSIIYFSFTVSIFVGIAYIVSDPFYQVITKLPPISAIFNFIKTSLEAFGIDNSQLLIMGLAGVYYSYKTYKKRTLNIYSRFFEEFDNKLFQSIDTAKPYDALWGGETGEENVPVMPFLLPADTPWHEAWDKLCELISRAETSAQLALRKTDRKASFFSWGILVGPSGSGKSRMAVEFARWLRRETLTDDPTKERTQQLSKFATWWSTQVRRKPCGPNDPWDTAWLRPGEIDEQDLSDNNDFHYFKTHDQRADISTTIDIERLKKWQPRRSTFILLDDPFNKDSKKTIAAFSTSASSYKFPVVMLIVSPSVPDDLELSRDDNTGRWKVKKIANMRISPIDMGSEQHFSEKNIRVLAEKMLTIKERLASKIMEDTESFRKKTAGLPFLVELGFSWLRSGQSLENMNQNSLLAARITRIKEAVLQCGLTTKFLEIMTVATIVGSRKPVRKEKISGVSDLTEIDETQKLYKLFPHKKKILHYSIPPIRPRIVGEAFVKNVLTNKAFLEKTQHDLKIIAKNIIAAAWEINPEETLRFSRHVGFVKGDPLYSLLKNPPEGLFSAGYLFPIYAKAAILLSRTARPGTTRHEQANGMTLTAHGYIAKLSDKEVEENIKFLFSLPNRKFEYQWIQYYNLVILLQTLIAKYITSNEFSINIFSQYFIQLYKIVLDNFWQDKILHKDINTGIAAALATCDTNKAIQIISEVEKAHTEISPCREIAFWITESIDDITKIKELIDLALSDNTENNYSFSTGYIISRNIDYKDLYSYAFSKISELEKTETRLLKYLTMVTAILRAPAHQNDVKSFTVLFDDIMNFIKLNNLTGEIYQNKISFLWAHYSWIHCEDEDEVKCEKAIIEIRNIIKKFPNIANAEPRDLTYALFGYAMSLHTVDNLPIANKYIDQCRNIVKKFQYKNHRACNNYIAMLRCYIFFLSINSHSHLCNDYISEITTIINNNGYKSCYFQTELIVALKYYCLALSKENKFEECYIVIEKIRNISDNFLHEPLFTIELINALSDICASFAYTNSYFECKKYFEETMDNYNNLQDKTEIAHKDAMVALRSYCYILSKVGNINECNRILKKITDICTNITDKDTVSRELELTQKYCAEAVKNKNSFLPTQQ